MTSIIVGNQHVILELEKYNYFKKEYYVNDLLPSNCILAIESEQLIIQKMYICNPQSCLNCKQ